MGATDEKGAVSGPAIGIDLGILSGQKDEMIKDLVLVEVNPLSLGIEIAGGMMHVLIPRNTTIPTSKVYGFTTVFDNSTRLKFKVFEGERARTRQNKRLGELVLTGVQKAPRGVPKIDVTFELEANGLLKVTAKDRVTGKQKSTMIKTGRSSKKETERMIAEAKKFKDEDEMHKKKGRASLEFLQYVYKMRTAAMDNSLSSTEKIKVEDAVKQAFRWLDANNKQLYEVYEYEEKKKELEQVWKPISDHLGGGNGGGANSGGSKSGVGKSGGGGGARPFRRFVNLFGRSRG